MKIIIGGDVAVRQDCEKLFRECRSNELFGDVCGLFKRAERVLVNLECTATDKDTPIKKIGPNIKAPLNTVKTLKDAGVTDCILANNHIFDFGKAGMADTLAELEKHGINYTGFGENEEDSRRNMIITDGKTKVAVVAVCEHEYTYALPNRMGARPYDPYDTNEDIENAKRESDYVIVLYHGGKEECRYPSPRLLKACRSMVKHGADLVLCQHSHCIGCFEEFEGGKILYGQGNFHFISKAFETREDGGYMWNTGLLVEVDIDTEMKVTFIPTAVDGTSVTLAKGEMKEKLLDELFERSMSLKDGTWYDRWREFALSQERYRVVPKELYEEIAHFIDCEAHADVCREVYKTYNHTNEIEK